MKINGRNVALLMFLATSSGFLMGSYHHVDFKLAEPERDVRAESGPGEFSSEHGAPSAAIMASQSGPRPTSIKTSPSVYSPLVSSRPELSHEDSFQLGENTSFRESSRPSFDRSDSVESIDGLRDGREVEVVTSWSGRLSSAWANRPTLAQMRSSISGMVADVKLKLGFTPTVEEEGIVVKSLQDKVSSWPTLPTKLQIQQLIQDAIDALRNLRNPADQKVFTRLNEDGSYEKVITDPTGTRNDIVQEFDPQGNIGQSLELKTNSSYAKTAAFRIDQEQQFVKDMLGRNNDEHTPEEVQVVSFLKTVPTARLLEYLRTAPVDAQAGPVTRSRVVSALSSNAADVTGITAMRNAMRPESPQRQALDTQVAKINQAMSRALDRIFGERQKVTTPGQEAALQTRTQQMVKGLQDAFTALKKQFTPSTSAERLTANTEQFQKEYTATMNRQDAMILSQRAQRPETTSMVDTKNPEQPTAYSKFLKDRSYADMRADLANPKLGENNRNGYTSRQQVATDMANKMLQDSGLAKYVVPANRAIGRQMSAAQRAVNTQISNIREMFTRKVTVDAEKLPAEQKPNFISKALTDMYNSITALANRVMGRPAQKSEDLVDVISLDQQSSGAISMAPFNESQIASTESISV